MRRSELYEKVWSQPVIKLARELGITDVGLARLCRRHAIPVPPRGYWAKVRAGQRPSTIPLPTPDKDEVIVLIQRPSTDNRRKVLIRAKEKVTTCAAGFQGAPADGDLVPFPNQLEKPYPLVLATLRYCTKIPRIVERFERSRAKGWLFSRDIEQPPIQRNGRYELSEPGQLKVTASLDVMDWVLRFHDVVFKSLIAKGVKIVWKAAEEGRNRRDSIPARVELSKDGEVFRVEFVQGYSRVKVAPADLEKRRKEHLWSSAYDFIPADRMHFRVIGSEYNANRAWEGPQDKLQQEVPAIIHEILALVPLQAALRREREAAAEIARQKEIAAEAARRRKASRIEQLKKAYETAELSARRDLLAAFLERLEVKIPDMDPLRGERCRTWIQIVREELAESDPVERLVDSIVTVPAWATWPPDWWPDHDEAP
jgi:hypothetical protein